MISYKKLDAKDAEQPDVIDHDGVKYIKVSVHNQKIIHQKWAAEREQLQRVTSLISQAIELAESPIAKATLIRFRQRMLDTIEEIRRRLEY